MSTERDTHFQGFAKLLYDDFLQLREEDESTMDEFLSAGYLERWRVKVERLIAQRACDLAMHVMNIAPVTEWEWYMSDIPDLTEWPTLD